MSEMRTRLWLVGILGSAVIRLLGSTLRWDVTGYEHWQRFRKSGQPVVYVFWHCWIFPLAYHRRAEGLVVMASQHRDGEYIHRVVQRMGFGTVRGSSTRGGVSGLKQLVHEGRRGRDLGLTPDGPRGPARQIKPGALMAAQILRAPVIPVSVSVTNAWRLNSWDRFVIPKPFARVRISYGPPLFVPPDAETGSLEHLAEEVAHWMEAPESDAPWALKPRGP